MIAWLRGKLAHRKLPRCQICGALIGDWRAEVCSEACETALWERRA